MGKQHYRVPVSELNNSLNMLSGEIWPCGDISPQEVREAASSGKIETRPWTAIEQQSPESQGPNRLAWDAEHKDQHIRRIAYFVRNGVPDHDSDPITVGADVLTRRLGLPGHKSSSSQPFHIAGRHRLAAAVIRGDKNVEMTFYGNLDIVKQHLPGAISLPGRTDATVDRYIKESQKLAR